MNGPPGPGGLLKAPEQAFRDNLRATAAGWHQRLRATGSLNAEAEAVGREAGELRRFAEHRGWRAIADKLQQIERVSHEAPQILFHVVADLSVWQGLAGEAAPPPGALAPPPMMTVRMEPPPAASLEPSRVPAPAAAAPMAPPPMISLPGAQLPILARPEAAPGVPVGTPGAAPPRTPGPGGGHAAGLPDTMAKPAPPQFVVKNMLGLRAFGNKGDPVVAPSAPDKPLLGLAKKSSSRPPAAAGLLPREAAASGPPLGVPERFARARSEPQPGDRRRPQPDAPSQGRRRSGRVGGPPLWFYAVAGAGALLGAAVVAVVLLVDRGRVPAVPARASAGSAAVAATARGSAGAATVDPPEAAAPAPQTLGHESPQLRALIEEQLRLVASCRTDPTKCSGWTPLSQGALTPVDPRTFTPTSPSAGPLSAWLRRLKVPGDFPLNDNTVLEGIFEYNTKNIAARAEFQQKHFNCSAYEDIFDAALIKYGAPSWLKAVVYQESGCDVAATSPAGARGLWQFMPESGRAYGLRVSEDEVDQRLDPVRATDAAVHFLSDLKRDLGSWDLALAAYNMGPLGVFSRIMQVGGKAMFWDLARAGLLPDETARYVPAIEAYALILENLRALNLGGGGKHPQSTAEITVKPGTRLSLVARAAHTSALHIRELNRAYLKDIVPDGETTVWVPDSEAHRAQVYLDTAVPDDKVDTCVPEDFDWGTTVLENSRYAKKCAPGAPGP